MMAVAAVLLASCGSGVGPGEAGSTTSPSPVSTVAGATTTPADAPVDLVARCGAAEFPLGTVELTGEPLDASGEAAIEALASYEEEGSSFATGYTWTVVSHDESSLVLVGVADGGGYADASFEPDGDGWRPVGWGTCHLQTAITRPGYATGHWILDPSAEPDPASSTLDVWVMERSCAGGQAPEGREVVPIVETSDDTITITVVIEMVEGEATCPSNPWYATTFELDEALGDRVLVDGFLRPGLVRPWPPTETSLGTLGDEE